MREIPISKFKTTCLSVLEEVRQTGIPVRVTRFGRPLADIQPPNVSLTKSWLGCMKAEFEVSGDLIKPIGAFEGWRDWQP